MIKAEEIVIQKLSQVEWRLKKDEESAHQYRFPQEYKDELERALEIINKFKEQLVKES